MNEAMDDLGPEEKELLREHGASLKALRARHADCPRPEVILASREGVLPEEAARKVSAHVAKCGFCQILLKDMADESLIGATVEDEKRVRERILTAAKPETKKASAPGGLFSIWFWKALPVGALAAAAIALFVWARLHQTSSTVTPPVAVVQPASKLDPAKVLEWEKLPIKLQAQSILIWRGNPRNAQEKYASELTSALAYYRDDKFPEATERLGKVAKDFPKGVEGQLYLGISELKLEQNADAIAPLLAAQKLGPEQYRDDATWFLALAYLRAGDVQSGRAELQKLCGGTSDYATRACAASKTLAAIGAAIQPN
jgi:hypothetical protein